MHYSRIEVNLLPPELQPGPAVRYALLINILIIGATVALILLPLSVKLNQIQNLRRDVEELKRLNAEKAPIEQQYKDILQIQESVESYGRLVALASADYVAMPVLMDKLSRVLPDGVFVERVTNQGTRRRGQDTVVSIALRTADTDVEKMRRTVENFKKDKLFANSYIRSGNIEETTLDEFLDQIGVTWNFSGPGVDSQIPNRNYTFEIITAIPRDFEVEGLPVLLDQARFYEVTMLVPPPAPPDPKAAGAAKPAAGAAANSSSAAAAPAGQAPRPGAAAVEDS